jgi:very-short-patch-repair endonuclease
LAGTAGSASPDFIEAVAVALRARGLKIVSKIGVAGGAIDLAVVDPGDENRFLFGIDSDHGHHFKSGSVRDRNRLRQVVLDGMGWRIHRVWSTDWFRGREREITRIVDLVAELADQP